MIPNSTPNCQIPVQGIDVISSWQQQLQQCVSDLDELLALLDLKPAQLGDDYQRAAEACQSFALRVPRAFIQRMRKGDIDDPLLQQVLPISRELSAPEGFSLDPLHEADNNPQPGIIHKYQSRALLISSQSCAINCRYCFRRHFPYGDNQLSRQQRDTVIDYLQQQPEINEVILSGGDPLVSSDRSLQALVDALAELPQLKRLRIHTRLPIVLPARVSTGLLQALSRWPQQLIVVTHSNHANEIDSDVASALLQLKQLGATLLNQAVLLRGINDSTDALVNLSEALFDHGVIPYYLHLLDPVIGAAHFHVDDEQAQRLVGKVSAALPGFLVPTLVRETAGHTAKTPIPPIF